MTEKELNEVWVASANLESAEGDRDRADSALDSAIAGAMGRGQDLASIGEAANLTATELVDRIDSPDFGGAAAGDAAAADALEDA